MKTKATFFDDWIMAKLNEIYSNVYQIRTAGKDKKYSFDQFINEVNEVIQEEISNRD